MPIDPSIPLGIKPVQIDSPINTLGRMYQFREQQAQAEGRQMALRQARQAETDRGTLGRAYSALKLTRESAIKSAVDSGAGHLVPIINKQFDDWDEAASKRKDLLDKARQAEQGYMGRLIAGVESHGYDSMSAMAAIDHAEGEFGEEFAPRATKYREEIRAANGDPAKIKMFVDGIKAQDPGYAARITAEASRTSAQTRADTAAVDKPGKQAGVRQTLRADAAAQLAAAQSQAQYETIRNGLTYDVARLFPDRFDREKVLQVGLTPVQAGSDADRDAARTQAKAIADRNANIASRNASTAEGNLTQRKDEYNRSEGRRTGPDSLSMEARATAERWKANQLATLRGEWDSYAEKDASGKAYEGEELRIENEYRAQMGLPRVSAVPWASTKRGAPSTDAAAVVAPQGTLGALMPAPAAPPKPAAPPPPAPAKPAAAAPPPAQVRDILKDQKPGVFTMSDGSIWRKQRDGSIVRVERDH